MTTTDDERHCRIYLMLKNGGTKISKALFEKCVKDQTPEDHIPHPWNLDHFLNENKNKILGTKTGKSKEKILFPGGVASTQVEQWDLYMYCFFLIEICGVKREVRIDIAQLRKMRNKMCHSNESTIDIEKYGRKVDKIEVIYERLLKAICDDELTTEVNRILESSKEDPLSCKEIIFYMHEFYKTDLETREILTQQSADIKTLIQEVRELKMKLNRESTDSVAEDLTKTCMELQIKNCSWHTERFVSNVIAGLYKTETGQSSCEQLEQISEQERAELVAAVQDTIARFALKKRTITDAEPRCVVLLVQCSSVSSLLTLFHDCINGDLTKEFKKLESAIRHITGLEEVSIEAVIYKDEFYRTMQRTVSVLDESVTKTYGMHLQNIQIQNTYGITDVRLVERLLPNSDDERQSQHAVRITIKTDADRKMQLRDSIKSGSFDSSICRLKEEICKHYKLSNLSIEAKLLEEGCGLCEDDHTYEEKSHRVEADHRVEDDHRVGDDHTVEDDHRVEDDHTVEDDHRVGDDHTVEDDDAAGDDHTVEDDHKVGADHTVEDDHRVEDDHTVEDDHRVGDDHIVKDDDTAGDDHTVEDDHKVRADHTVEDDHSIEDDHSTEDDHRVGDDHRFGDDLTVEDDHRVGDYHRIGNVYIVKDAYRVEDDHRVGDDHRGGVDHIAEVDYIVEEFNTFEADHILDEVNTIEDRHIVGDLHIFEGDRTLVEDKDDLSNHWNIKKDEDRLSNMKANNIYDLIENSHKALAEGNEENAKRFALHAIIGINKEKETFLTGQQDTVTEQELADWYGECAFILNTICEFITAAKCFYTAIIFDAKWKVETHTDVAQVLWNALVFEENIFILSGNFQKIRILLADLDTLARLAERRRKWSVCINIDGDINKVYTFLRVIGFIQEDLISQPGRKSGIWRAARCYLQLNLHQEVRKLCSTILQHVCDYDDSEALEIWARSLYNTGDYDLALQKNQLALKYCSNKSDQKRLYSFEAVLAKKLEESSVPQICPDESWLKETNAICPNAIVRRKLATPGIVKRRKKRRKAIGRSGSTTPMSRLQSLEGKKETSLSSSTSLRDTENATISTATFQLKSKNKFYERLRNVSGCSAATSTNDTSDYETETSYDYSVSDSDPDDDESVNYYLHSRNESPDQNLISEQDAVIDNMQEQMSFYEQSCRFYQKKDEVSERLGRAECEETLLKTGITLNMSYLHKFEDQTPNILKQECFYTEFLDKAKLQELMLKNPKKYIRCTIQIEGCHEAFCCPVDSHDSISIIEISGRSKIGQAFNEDEVIVEILDDHVSREKRYGKVIGIWNRQRHDNTKHPVFICTLDDMESHLVRPMCKTIPKIHVLNIEIKQKYKDEKDRRNKVEIYEYDEKAGILCNPKIFEVNPAEQGSVIFLVAFIKWGARHIYPKGAIIKRLPSGSSVATGLMILNLQHEVPTLYKKETVEQVLSIVKRTGEEPPVHMLHDRVNLTNLNTFTIDPPGSKDLDDALSIEIIEGGYKVGVHIADVAVFIPRDSPLDEEAQNRATTFYSGIRKPRNMIPEPLSSNICSLLEDKLRLTISVFFYIGINGRLLCMEGNNVEIVKSYIKSKKQLTYGQAQELIYASPDNRNDILTNHIKCLSKIAHAIRKKRLGNAMFALDDDWEEIDQDLQEETQQAHYLIEEFMIMTNKKVAERLLMTYRDCVPLCCQPPPSKESIDAFFKRNDQYLDILVRFQDKQFGPKRSSVNDCRNNQTSHRVMLLKSIWEEMVKSPKIAAAKLIRKDDIHPLQLVIYQHWLSIQERAGYRCSGSLVNKEDFTHFSLNMFAYTHFTSPISRYNDLIVQRLVHAAVFQEIRSPYEKEEIDNICKHINSVAERAKAYEKGCKLLQQAMDYKTNPEMINCYVDEVTERGVMLCSPFLKYIARNSRELTFNHLDMVAKPEVLEDLNTHCNMVQAIWRKRLYDFYVRPNYPSDRENELKLNPYKEVVFLPLCQWAEMLKSTMEGHKEDLSRAVRNANVVYHEEGLDDVSTECFDPLNIQPSTRFSMTFSRGQQLKIQMSGSPNKGMIAPKPMLYDMTNNVKLCLQHIEDPVFHLYRYATRGTCDQYKSVKVYLERWLPLMLMESATSVVKNEESCNINNVQIKFSGDRKGKFALGLAECEVRNIELSGLVSDDDDDEEFENNGAKSYDWLCLKTTLPARNTVFSKKSHDFKPLESVWVGHAEVTRVKRKKKKRNAGKITVSFTLHERAPELPPDLPLDHQRFSIEILRKSEVDRRTETFIKMLPSVHDTLAAKIALNKKIPDLDKDHKHIASLIERDLNYEACSDDTIRKPLPPNNKKQHEAIDRALMSRFSLIQGPPGTGKTYTGIKLVSLFNKINDIQHKEGKQRKQVLFCGPSNRSVDLVAEWMYNRMGNYCPDFVRVYGRSIEALDFPIPGRTFLSKTSTRNQKTSPILYPVALHHLIRQKGKKYAEEINAYDKLFKANNYMPMPEKVAAYVRVVREASIDEIRKHDVILCTTAVGSNPKMLKALNVHQVIVDEAGMCTEPQCLVPIIATKAEQVVLIGDHKQLRPIIMCREAGLLGMEMSLFERYAVTNTKQFNNVKFTMLEQQYRMNPQICRFPSANFYKNALITMPGAWSKGKIRIWPRCQNEIYPHIFVHVEGEEKVLTVSTEEGNEQSKSNIAEIDEVIKVYSYFTREQPTESVHILSQYNAQVSEIKRRLKEDGYVDENVSTVVSSQGGEWDYVIFSTVRSLPEYKIESNPTLGWCKHYLGFITDQNQINVALTRARKGLIIIGNKNLLSSDQFVWKKLIHHYENLDCMKTPNEFPPRVDRTRLQKMKKHKLESERRYGESMYFKGEATSYTGSFHDWQEFRRKRHRRCQEKL